MSTNSPLSPEKDFVLTALTVDPAVIRAADEAGVDRIGIDIERVGKHLRQGHDRNARISDHRVEDLSVVTANVNRAEVFIRVNPVYAGSKGEIDHVIELGARVVMLPYFTDPHDVIKFLDMLAGRAKPVLLLETGSAAAQIREIAAMDGVVEIMVGLNDLGMSLGYSNPFEVLTSDLIGNIGEQIRRAGRRFGFGGLARVDDIALPVPPDLVYAQYARLGATSAWLARSFYGGIEPRDIPQAVRQLRERLAYWRAQPAESLEHERQNLARTLRALGDRPL